MHSQCSTRVVELIRTSFLRQWFGAVEVKVQSYHIYRLILLLLKHGRSAFYYNTVICQFYVKQFMLSRNKDNLDFVGKFTSSSYDVHVQILWSCLAQNYYSYSYVTQRQLMRLFAVKLILSYEQKCKVRSKFLKN